MAQSLARNHCTKNGRCHLCVILKSHHDNLRAGGAGVTILILLMRKLRLREVGKLPKVTQLVSH